MRKKIERSDEVILQFFISYCILIVEFRVGELEEFRSWFSVSSPWVPGVVYPGVRVWANAKTQKQCSKRTSVRTVSFILSPNLKTSSSQNLWASVYWSKRCDACTKFQLGNPIEAVVNLLNDILEVLDSTDLIKSSWDIIGSQSVFYQWCFQLRLIRKAIINTFCFYTPWRMSTVSLMLKGTFYWYRSG
jgi:hypothetical protein